MRIPASDLDDFGADLIDKCLSTRPERIQIYNGFKHYMLFGSHEGEQAPYNKIGPHMELLGAYLYSQSSVEFDVSVENKPDIVYEQAELISARTNIYYHEFGIADLFADALRWALCYNSMFVKLLRGRGSGFRIKPYLVEPHNFGVLREDVNCLQDQEAFVHCYRISWDELRRRIMGLPNAADVLRRVTPTPATSVDTYPEPVNRMIIAGTVNMTNTTTRGFVNIPDLLGTMAYQPKPIEDTVEMYELWVWDDDKDDYRTITMCDPGITIYDGKAIGNTFGIKGEHPFVQVCPNRLPDYFYGWSEITNLIKLQDWLTVRLTEIRNILSKQANPPKYLSGFQGITDEKIAALQNPGSWISEPTMGAKVETVSPDLPNDLFQEFLLIQDMFNDESGLSDVLQGKGETGVRAKGHADILARLGSARIKQRALAIERSINELGEKTVKLMQAKDTRRYELDKTPDEKGKPTTFVAAQFPEDHQVRVDAHSASPVFVSDHEQKALMLAKAGAIDGDSLIEQLKPPRYQTLRKRLKKNKEEKMKQQQAMLAAGMTPDGKPLKRVA